ncbi:nucleotide disphospho-sugar-binding domain-containing protein [Polymorphospora rubra]|uniref:nucleotide disphospho-sugar-binding domain-containing protein n=1 Tax=Polymorphospora rubra TaxID=338584 RepID=UPI0033C7E7F7
MRVLFITSPGVGHTFQTIPTVWAFRAAGHDVILATGHYRGYDETPARAGLHVVDVAPGLDFAGVFSRICARDPELAANLRDPAVADELAVRIFAEFSAGMLYGTMTLAERWRPDLVVHTPLDGTGALVAAKLGVPTVIHAINFDTPLEMTYGVYDRMRPEFERFGVTAASPAAMLDLAPPSMRASNSSGWPMRYLPYNGGGVLPDWLYAPRKRPRITVTLGSVLPQMLGSDGFRPFLAGASEVDAEFVLTVGNLDPAELRGLPPNVRPVKWLPLSALLAVSDAAVHHGGAGTTLTTVEAGVPQLIIPQTQDQFPNSEAVAKRGIGLPVQPGDLDAERLHGLLTNDAMRDAARQVATEMRTSPPAAELVPKLVALAG